MLRIAQHYIVYFHVSVCRLEYIYNNKTDNLLTYLLILNLLITQIVISALVCLAIYNYVGPFIELSPDT